MGAIKLPVRADGILLVDAEESWIGRFDVPEEVEEAATAINSYSALLARVEDLEGLAERARLLIRCVEETVGSAEATIEQTAPDGTVETFVLKSEEIVEELAAALSRKTGGEKP